ncbi:MAG: hypothetical protein ACLP00_21520 [Terracidiphilus sp.]
MTQFQRADWEQRRHRTLNGNKRTAMEVAFVFLEFNGYAVRASQEDASAA